MRIYELVNFNRELLERIHRAGIRPDDYKYADLYAEYRALVAGGEKVTYIVSMLSVRYGVSERQVYNLLDKFNREITYCNPVAVE